MLDGGERFVGLIEREDASAGCDADFHGEGDEVFRVLAGHVGDAAQLALAPEERVVVKLGDVVKVDRIDGDDSTFAQGTECGDDDAADGRECDGGVEQDRRLVRRVTDPGCAELAGELAVLFAARGDINLAVPVVEDFDGEVGGCSEAEETDAVAGLHARYAEAAKADDPGAEQRRECCCGVIVRQVKAEIGADYGILGITAIDGIAGEDGIVAEVFEAFAAQRAVAVDAAHP